MVYGDGSSASTRASKTTMVHVCMCLGSFCHTSDICLIRMCIGSHVTQTSSAQSPHLEASVCHSIRYLYVYAMEWLTCMTMPRSSPIFTLSTSGCAIAARTDWLWMPNITQGGPQMASGRPWPYTGDNPAPYIDPDTGHVRALYRTDSHSGGHVGYQEASLVGAYTAPSWRGPYTDATRDGGSISGQDYPWDENEDPFLWRSARGWHALMHANTWVDSRGASHSVM